MNFMGMGPMELGVILLIAFLVLGPGKSIDAAGTRAGYCGNSARASPTWPPRWTWRNASNPTDRGIRRRPNKSSLHRSNPAMNERELTLVQHLGELRKRVFWSVVALLAGSAVAFAFFRQIIELLVRPARDLGPDAAGQLIYTEVTELLTTSVKVSFVGGFILALPVILYHVIMFVAPGLTRREKRYLLAFLPAAFLAFVCGVAFAYFVMSPPALHFLLTFGGDVATPMIRVSNIVN